MKKIMSCFLVLCLFTSIFAHYQKANASEDTTIVWFSAYNNSGTYPYAHPGETVTFNFDYTGNQIVSNVSVSILRDNDIVFEKDYGQKNKIKEDFLLSKTGTYIANVVAKVGERIVSNKAEVNVLNNLPIINKQPTDITVSAGQTVTFTCLASNTNTYQWYSASSPSTKGNKIVSGTTNTLIIKNVVEKNNGMYYYCLVGGDNDKKITSNYARLFVSRNNIPSTKPTIKPIPSPTILSKVYLSGSYNNNIVSLKWDGYATVYRATSRQGKYKKLYYGKNNYKDKKIVAGKTYFYKIVQNAKSSNIIKVNARPIPIIYAFKTKKIRRKAKLLWKIGKKVGKSRVLIYIKTNKNYKKLATVSASKYPCFLNVPKQYHKVYVKIKSYNTVQGKKFYSKFSKPIKLNF